VAWNRSGIACLAPVVLASLALLSGCNDDANARSGPRSPEKIYATTCGYCHGHNVGPVIRGRQLPAETVTDFVRRGNGAMPAFRPTEISNEELKALATWIQTSKADPKEHGQ
jgi:mono/diheme cytochrome c family protein